MTYVKPEEVTSPQGQIEGQKVTPIFEHSSGGWSVARFNWRDKKEIEYKEALGIRWNGSPDEAGKGFPKLGYGNPAWFVLPKELHQAIKEKVVALKMEENYRQMAQAEASGENTDEWNEESFMENTPYGFGKTVNLPFDEAVEKTRAALAGQGFGVLADIDVAATLKAKLGQDMAPYRILGACNPPLAHQAIVAEPDIGLLLPCNVIVRGLAEGGVRVAIMDPAAVLGLVARPELVPLAQEVRARLEKALAQI